MIVAADATLEQKVEFLLRRASEAQRDIQAAAQRVAAIEEESPERLEDLRVDLHRHVGAALDDSEARYHPTRWEQSHW